LNERSASGATKGAASIREATEQLKEHPHSGYRTDDPDVRVIFVPRCPYKIFYRVRDAVDIFSHPAHISTSMEKR
jgi:toxin ParE1/3/4